MSLLTTVAGWMGYAKRSNTRNPSQWFVDWVNGGAETSSGASVNEDSALKYTPFWAAVRVISGTVASLPFLVYRRTADGGKVRATEQPAYKLLHDRPNQYMDALTFIETRQAHVLAYGNGYAEIQRDGAGRPIALWPLLPNQTVRKITDTGVPFYEVSPSTGGVIQIPDYNVLHIKGLGFDGYTGYDVVAYQKEAIGYGVAVKEYGSRFFGNGATTDGGLEHPGNLTEKAQDQLRASWNSKHQGLSNAHRLAIFEEGMKWIKMGVDPEQAQALDTQKYTVDDCARIFNIPPHKLASMESSTFSNIEEQNIDFVSSTLMYWFRKWEQECNYKLFMPADQQKFFCEILVDGLLRGDTAARSASYTAGRQWGYLSANDIRAMENKNGIGPKGDIYLEPLNMKPAGTENPSTAPPPEPEPDDSEPEDDDTRQAHRELLAGQWARVITKQNNATKKVIKPDFYDGLRAYALTIMLSPVYAYASTKGAREGVAKEALEYVIEKYINKDTTLDAEASWTLADRVIEKLGGNNA